jgi:glycosyltransferase involved in cell wall biosynthesis
VKIALLASTFLPRIGGAELAVHNLAMQFKKLGHEVTVVTWWGQGRAVRNQVSYPVRTMAPRSFTIGDKQRLGEGLPFYNKVAPQIAWLQQRHCFDVWNIQHTFPFGVLAGSRLRRLEVPFVATPQGDDVIYDPASHYDLMGIQPIRRRMAECLMAAQQVTSISQTVTQALVDLGVPIEQITDIPNGVLVDAFAGPVEPRETVLRRYDIPTDVPLLLSVGRNHPQKGYDLIPPTMERLCADGVPCTWAVVGTDTHHLVKNVDPKIAQHIRCIPAILSKEKGEALFNRLPSAGLVALYRASDIFVIPSRMEGCPLVGAEALAAGLPIVGTTGMGAPDMVVEGEGGFVVRKNDSAALAKRIEVLVSDRNLRERMGQFNHNRGRKRYDWEVVTRQYVACFEEAITAARGR